MTGVFPSPYGKEKWHSEKFRSTLLPSARLNDILRFALSPMAFQSFSAKAYTWRHCPRGTQPSLFTAFFL
jgi:hypothetical protein